MDCQHGSIIVTVTVADAAVATVHLIIVAIRIATDWIIQVPRHGSGSLTMMMMMIAM